MDDLLWRTNRNLHNRREKREHITFCATKRFGYLEKQWWYEYEHKRRAMRRQERAFAAGHRSAFCLV